MAAHLHIFISQLQPMKLHYLILVSAILTAAACKKHEKITPVTPPPATKDFREKYTGVFNVTKLHWHRQHPSGGVATEFSQPYTGTVKIGYQMSDSVDNLSKLAGGGESFKQAALKFTYGNGTQQLMGVDTLGKLYQKTGPAHGNYGGFITVDSIYHVVSDGGGSFTDTDTIYAKRQ